MEENSKWEVGDVALCVKVGNLTDSPDAGMPPPLRLNAEYVVNGVNICGDCGTIKLDVGLNSPGNEGTRCNCGAKTKPGTGIHWANAIRFVKKKTREAIRDEMNEAIHNEDYELARKLDDQLNKRP